MRSSAGLLRRSLTAIAVALVVAVPLAAGPVARAGTANGGLAGAPSGNPIAGVRWGVDRGAANDLYTAYAAARGRERRILARIALLPATTWIGYWDRTDAVSQTVAQIIADTTGGNPAVMAQLATFTLNPWEQQACGFGGWTVGATDDWYRQMADGIAGSRVMVILQIDLPFALCTHSSRPEQIDTFAAAQLTRLPRTTVYLDAGSAGWEPPRVIARLLIRSGVRDARGFALDDTQYGSTSFELGYGAQVLAALAADGVPGKHFIVDTDENGQPYGSQQVHGNSNDTPRCATRTQTVCQRTGIPPTTDVANPRWRLGARARRIARADADAYVWSGRPWNVNGGPFNLGFALDLAANGAY